MKPETNNSYRLAFIDDSLVEHKLLKLLIRIKELPFELITFSNPVTALEQLKGMENGDFPHAIILDINMPFITGFDLVEQLESKLNKEHAQTLIYIVSSSIRPDEKEKARLMPHITDFMEKPITREKLDSILEELRKGMQVRE